MLLSFTILILIFVLYLYVHVVVRSHVVESLDDSQNGQEYVETFRPVVKFIQLHFAGKEREVKVPVLL